MAREAVADAVQNIANNRTGWRRHNPDDTGQKRNGQLAVLVKETFFHQALAAIFQQLQQGAFARQLHRFYNDLIL